MKKRTLFLGFLLMLALSTDVPADSWARESIDKAAEYGLMNGVGEGRFGLGETISREQFVTILVRMFGWESVSGEDAVLTLEEGCIIRGNNGTGDVEAAIYNDGVTVENEGAIFEENSSETGENPNYAGEGDLEGDKIAAE